MNIESLSIPASDGFLLPATCYRPLDNPTRTVITINSATAVPQRYYKSFAAYLAEQGYTVITYDFRGIGQARPRSLRGFKASLRDWALKDMAGVIDWIEAHERPQRLFHVGHSFGGQTPGLLPNGDQIDAMVTFSSQSGYWGLQGGNQKLPVALHMYVTFPLMCGLFGYMPWSKFSSAEDLPREAALEWAKWCRRPNYLLDDPTLPLERYQQFQAPVLAYSFDDDNWGTRRSVDAMMSAYPSLTRRHVIPAEVGMKAIGHFGFFRSRSQALWPDVVNWLEQAAPFQSEEPA